MTRWALIALAVLALLPFALSSQYLVTAAMLTAATRIPTWCS